MNRSSNRTSSVACALAASALVSACGLASAATSQGQGQLAAVKEIQSMYRGLTVIEDQGRPHVIAGLPMGGGQTARASAESWVVNHMSALGGGGSTFQEAWNAVFSDGSKTVFCYQQYIDGLPVEYGIAKVLVLNNGTNPVVYAAGTLAPAPAQGFPAMTIDGKTARAIAQSLPASKKLTVWSTPEAVIYQGNGDWIEPVKTWKITGESPNINDAARITYFIDAATGQLAGMRNEVVFDVNGTVKGNGSPGLLPDTASNPPSLFNMPEIKVANTGFSSVFTDRNGAFTAPSGAGGTTTSTGVSTLNGWGGRWSDVRPTGSSGITASQAVTPPGPANLTLNPSPAAGTTAQVNAFLAANAIHDYFRDRSGTFSGIDISIPTNTAVAGTCNAFFNGSSINFYNAGGGCVNSAYTTVVAHEYGHFIVSKLGNGAGLPQNAFGEGYGDTSAMLCYDTTVIAADFFGPGSPIRNPATANQQYPCSDEIHTCGQVIAGVWWDIRTAFGAFYGSGTGLTNTRQLEVNWSLVTTGGPNSSNSAGPSTLTEVLVTNDNDGNLGNGTPDSTRICPAFAGHGITNGNCGGGGGPANNNCANAVVINNGVTPFTTVGATTDGPTTTCNGFNDPQINQDIWYTYTATVTGVVTVQTCGSSFDTKIAVYSGAGCPVSSATEIACNDDSCSTQSSLNFNSVFGQQYKIRVGGYQTATGTGNITISAAIPNDLCANAIAVGVGNTNFDNRGATTDGPTTTCNTSNDPQVNQDLWYTYTASCTGNTTISLCGSSYDTKIAVYSGAGCPASSATEVACNDDFCNLGSQVTFPTTAGQVFKVRVGAYLDRSGTGTMAITCAPTACYANCDGSTQPPILNVNDFTCFLNKYAAGCP